MKEVGDRIELVAKEAGIRSNQVLADLLEVSEGLIRHIKKNGTNNKFYIEKIAKEYGYNYDWLAFGRGEKKNPNFRKKTELGALESKKELSDFHDLEIIEYIAQNIDRFRNYEVFRYIGGIMEIDKIREKLKAGGS